MKIIIIKISGSIPSKKNNKRLFKNKRTKKLYPANSEKYNNWHKGAVFEVKNQCKIKTLQKVEFININIIYPDFRRRDLTNTAESIMDLLVDAEILKDDNWLVVPKLHLNGYYKKNEFFAEVEILL